MARVGIFYWSATTNNNEGELTDEVTAEPVTLPGEELPCGYMRVEVATPNTSGGDDLTDALDKANPQRGESVMNTHYIDG